MADQKRPRSGSDAGKGRSGGSGRGGPPRGRSDGGGDRRHGGRASEPDRPPRRESGPRAPAIDDDVTGKELDKAVRRELATLDSGVAGTVARHLVMVARLIDTDPEAAFAHAQHAKSRAGRVAVVREAAGEAAYTAGHFDEALKEFTAARRISGRDDLIAVIADCHRGVGRPDKAIALLDDPAVATLPVEVGSELAVVVAGALRDTGRETEALALLERAMPASAPREQWVARMQYALGDLLAEAGRTHEAVSAFASAESSDLDGDLDAGERVTELLEGNDST